MEHNLTLMKKSSLFNPFSTKELETYLKKGVFTVKKYQKENILHFEDEPCTKLEIILSGLVVVERIDEEGNILTISEFLGGDLLGGNLLFSGNPRYPMTITAMESTTIIEIQKGQLFQLFIDCPNFLRVYLEFVSDHAFILGNKIRHYVNKTIRESILNYIKYEQAIQNSNTIKLNITKKALAEKIGVQRTSISRELSKMKDDGLILYDAKTLTLL